MKPLKQYRGISVDDNEFVYGYLTVEPLTNEYVIQETDGLGWGCQYEIDQDCIDICIGVDTDGKDIFENDIVRILFTDWGSQDDWVECMVYYDENDRQFKGKSITPNRFNEYEIYDLTPGKFGWIKVVNNKYYM